MTENIENIEKDRCHDCGVRPGELHDKGCDWEICSMYRTQLLSRFCHSEGIRRIPFGTVREIAARIPIKDYGKSSNTESYYDLYL